MTSEEHPDPLAVVMRVIEFAEAAFQRLPDYRIAEASTVIGSAREAMVVMGDQYVVSGQVGAVGRTAHVQMTSSQMWIQISASTDIGELETELSILRDALRTRAVNLEDYLSLAEVVQAEIAASERDGPKVMEHLSKAGRWALDTASEIGNQVAAAAIQKALGL